MRPDALIIQDPTLLHQVDLFNGLAPNGFILLNSTRGLEELASAKSRPAFPRATPVPYRQRSSRSSTSAATSECGAPGGFAAITGELTIEAVTRAIAEKFPGAVGEKRGRHWAAFDAARTTESAHA